MTVHVNLGFFHACDKGSNLLWCLYTIAQCYTDLLADVEMPQLSDEQCENAL